MAENTKIEWATHTFNPWIGCTKVTSGCANCYAEHSMDKHWRKVKWGPQGTRSVTSPAKWAEPIKWNRWAAAKQSAWDRQSAEHPAGEEGLIAAGFIKPERPRVFCASLADIFEDWDGPMLRGRDKDGTPFQLWHFEGGFRSHRVTSNIGGLQPVTMNDLRLELFRMIDATPHLDWLLLTKRPENIRGMWPTTFGTVERGEFPQSIPRENVWLGTSISEQPHADKQIPDLLKCRDLSPVLFLSAEPLLGEVHLSPYINGNGEVIVSQGVDLDWVIVGGESGIGSRFCHLNHIDLIRWQCEDAGVPCFVKQLGSSPVFNVYSIFENDDWSSFYRTTTWQRVPEGYTKWDHQTFGQPSPGSLVEVHLKDKKGGDWDEWPEAFRVRQFPSVASVSPC